MAITFVVLFWLTLGFIGHLIGCKYLLQSDWKKEPFHIWLLIFTGPLNILSVFVAIAKEQQ